MIAVVYDFKYSSVSGMAVMATIQSESQFRVVSVMFATATLPFF
jgi:hypothetical protein